MNVSAEILKHSARLSEKRAERRLESLSQHLHSLPTEKENAREKLADKIAIVYTFIFRQKKHVREKEPLLIENREMLIQEYAERILQNEDRLVILAGQIQNIVFEENLGCWQMAYEKVLEDKYGLEFFKSACDLTIYALNIELALETGSESIQ